MPDMDSVWSDADYARALDHLDRLQNQINELRAALPLTIAPLATLTARSSGWITSPSYIYATFHVNALKTAQRVQSLQREVKDDYTTQVLAKVKESVARDGNVKVEELQSTGVRNIKKEEEEDETEIVEGPDGVLIKQEANAEPETSEEDFENVVDSFVESFQQKSIIEVSRLNQPVTIKVAVRMQHRADSLQFTIQRTLFQDRNDWYFRAACVGGMIPKVRESITRSLEARPGRRDLQSTLYMLAAYNDFMLANCAKCKKKLGPNAILPTSRRRNGSETTDADPRSGWIALHEGCLS